MARGRFHGAAVCAAREHTARQRGAAAAPAATRLQAELPQKKQPRCLPDLAFSEQGRGQTVLAREPLAVPVPTVALSGSRWLLPQPASPWVLQPAPTALPLRAQGFGHGHSPAYPWEGLLELCAF